MLDPYWSDKAAEMRAHMTTDPIETFPEWAAVSATMFVGRTSFVEDEQAEMLRADRVRWWNIPEEIGGYPTTNIIHQAYHLFTWERNTGLRVESLRRIVEIGGGYGAMARICRGLGFTGEYVIYDLPEFSEIQRYYLDRTGVEAECRSLDISDRADLLIALYSLTEMGLETQRRYLDGLTARHYLIGIHNAPWLDVNTHAPLDAHFGDGQRVIHPHLDGRYYLIG